MLWGLLIVLFGFIGFFFVIGMSITLDTGLAFITALGIQGCSLWLVKGQNGKEKG